MGFLDVLCCKCGTDFEDHAENLPMGPFGVPPTNGPSFNAALEGDRGQHSGAPTTAVQPNLPQYPRPAHTNPPTFTDPFANYGRRDQGRPGPDEAGPSRLPTYPNARSDDYYDAPSPGFRFGNSSGSAEPSSSSPPTAWRGPATSGDASTSASELDANEVLRDFPEGTFGRAEPTRDLFARQPTYGSTFTSAYNSRRRASEPSILRSTPLGAVFDAGRVAFHLPNAVDRMRNPGRAETVSSSASLASSGRLERDATSGGNDREGSVRQKLRILRAESENYSRTGQDTNHLNVLIDNLDEELIRLANPAPEGSTSKGKQTDFSGS
jgi:hypothetical protein